MRTAYDLAFNKHGLKSTWNYDLREQREDHENDDGEKLKANLRSVRMTKSNMCQKKKTPDGLTIDYS